MLVMSGRAHLPVCSGLPGGMEALVCELHFASTCFGQLKKLGLVPLWREARKQLGREDLKDSIAKVHSKKPAKDVSHSQSKVAESRMALQLMV